MKKLILLFALLSSHLTAYGYAGRSQFLILPAQDFRFQTSISNYNYRAVVNSSAGESESTMTGFSQNFGAIYAFTEGHQMSLGSSYVNTESKLTSKRSTDDIRTKTSGLGNLDLGYQGVTEFEYFDLFYGLSYNFKHQAKTVRLTGQNAFEANAVQAQNSWTPSVGIAVPTAVNLTFGGELSHSIKEDGEVRVDNTAGGSVTTKQRQGNVTSIMGFVEFDSDYLPFLSLRRTSYAEQISETPASDLRVTNDPYHADTITLGVTLPISDSLRIEPRFSRTQYTYESKDGFSVSEAEQTSFNVGLTLMF